MCFQILVLEGCKYVCQPNWQERYSEALFKYRQGYTDSAIQAADAGYKQSERNATAWSWKFRILNAQALLRQHRPELAVSLLQPTPSAQLPIEVHVRRKIMQGAAFCQLHRTSDSGAVFDEAENLISHSERSMSAELAFARATCALSFDLAVATKYYKRSIDLAEGTDPYIQANSLIGLGYVLLHNEHYDEAIDALNQALPLTNYLVIRQSALGNLGDCYADLGDFIRAIDYSRQAADIAAQIGDSSYQQNWLLDLGHSSVAFHQFQNGDNALRKALTIAIQRNDRRVRTACLNNLVQLSLRTGNLETARQYWAEESRLDPEFPYVLLDGAQIAAAQKDFTAAEKISSRVLGIPHTKGPLRAMTQTTLANVYWAEKKNHEADRMFREALHTIEKSAFEISREELRLSFLDYDQFYEQYVRFLVSQTRLEEALRIADRARTILKKNQSATAPHDDISTKKIQAALSNRRQVILAYSVANEESFLWVITPEKFKLFRLPSHGELYSLIAAYNNEIQNHQDTLNSPTGQKLYRILIQPAEEFINHATQIVIVPSTILNLINFETLVVPGTNPHYWIDDVEIQVSGSVARLAQSSPVAKHGKGLLLIGAPIEVNKQFPVLTYAEAEVARIKKYFPAVSSTSKDATLVTGKDATPRAYRSNNPAEYRYIHLVTHGTASDKVPMDSAIILSPDADNSYKLYARDIVKTPLHADLVTISACYGAGTRWYQNAGLVGLSWAFLHAGAHQVVAGLWEVDDAATPGFMDHFYAELQRGKTAAAALRSAKLAMLHSKNIYQHPFYWGSLQLYVGS
jgi:CHAT domain-containing protein